jgi:hypothetical protein
MEQIDTLKQMNISADSTMGEVLWDHGLWDRTDTIDAHRGEEGGYSCTPSKDFEKL